MADLITTEQREEVSFRIDQEGLDYTLRNYSSFPEVKDPKFHELREAYIAAAEAFESYIGYGQ